jgi:hypothetical protein
MKYIFFISALIGTVTVSAQSEHIVIANHSNNNTMSTQKKINMNYQATIPGDKKDPVLTLVKTHLGDPSERKGVYTWNREFDDREWLEVKLYPGHITIDYSATDDKKAELKKIFDNMGKKIDQSIGVKRPEPPKTPAPPPTH